MILLQTLQKSQMRLSPKHDVDIVIARRHRAAHDQKQHLLQRTHHLARLTAVLDCRKMLLARGAALTSMASSSHQEALESRNAAPSCLFDARVNLNSLPWKARARIADCVRSDVDVRNEAAR
jgi:hypothetical protein